MTPPPPRDSGPLGPGKTGGDEPEGYRAWTIRVCERGGCLAVPGFGHRHQGTSHEWREVEVVPAAQLRGAVDALREIAKSDGHAGVVAANALGDLGIADPLLDRLLGERRADA